MKMACGFVSVGLTGLDIRQGVGSVDTQRGISRAGRIGRCRVVTSSATVSSSDVKVSVASRDGEGTSFEAFRLRAESNDEVNMVPVWRRSFSDQITPVELYRCLVGEDDVGKTSYLLESVLNNGNVGRYSFVGADPAMEVIAKEDAVTIVDRREGSEKTTTVRDMEDPWAYVKEVSSTFKPAKVRTRHSPSYMSVASKQVADQVAFVARPHRKLQVDGLPEAFMGGWVGYGGYDTARYVERTSLPFETAPTDDRGLPDLHMSIFRQCVAFDSTSKTCYITSWVDLREHDSLESAHATAVQKLDQLVAVLTKGKKLSKLDPGMVDIDESGAASSASEPLSTMTKEMYMNGVKDCQWHIREGDAFQIVLSQRFQRSSAIDPFSVYRALRIVNPSPYMIYMQCKDTILVASSPEILCRVEKNVVTNRPLAGTRRRGRTPEEDLALEKDLLQDEKELAEHRMLVDLGRNDVGRVAKYGTVQPTKLMEIERYSHVMHVSSTVIGKLREDLSPFDALRAALPAGTVSGAPKIRAMQILDKLEPTRRGPYGGGIGVVSFDERMNIALALRTMVIPTNKRKPDDEWLYYLQAGAGIVVDSVPEDEYEETVNKAMAMNRAIDLAEKAFN